jgi:Zn-dependent metalloprotease
MHWSRITAVFALLTVVFVFGAQQLNTGYAAAPSTQGIQPSQVAWEEVSPIFPDTGSSTPPTASKPVPQASVLAPQTEACGGVYPATADTVVRKTMPGTNFGSGNVWISQSNPPTSQDRILLRFDPYGAVPEGGLVQRAELELTLYSDPSPLTYTLQVYSQQNAEWLEFGVTWSSQPTPTIGFGQVSYAITQTEQYSSVVSLDVTTWAMLWATGAITNTGLTIAPAGSAAMTVSFRGREENLGSYAPRLKIFCAPAKTVVPLDSAPGDARQMTGLARLRANSTITPTLQLDSGVLRFADFRIPLPSTVSITGIARALWFTQAYSDALRIDGPQDGLQLIRRTHDDRHIFFRQLHRSVPVYPSEFAVHLNGTQVTGVSGGFIPEITLDNTPQLSAEQAEEIARLLAGTGVEVIGDTQLTYFNQGLSGDPDRVTYLAWLVNLSNNTAAFIDANTGKRLFNQTYSDGGFDLDLDSRYHLTPIDECAWYGYDSIDFCDEDGCEAAADDEGRLGFNNIRSAWAWYRFWEGQDSYDNDGAEVEMYVHVGDENGMGGQWYNASWAGGCQQMIQFGDLFARDLEIVGHEFTHAFTDHYADFICDDQPGALDESFADIFGQFIAGENDWNIGEGLPGLGTGRSMSHPATDRWSKYDDNKDVHDNAGIHNKAAYLITHGDQFNGYDTRPGIGIDKARNLFFDMLYFLTKSSTMVDARNAAVVVARALQEDGHFGFTNSDICKIMNGYAAVGLGNGDFNCDGVEDSVGPDSDYDGWWDVIDNCDDVPNPGQDDTDVDGIGDACDLNSDQDPYLDHVFGVVCNGLNGPNCDDNCQFEPQPNQNDWNHDGVGDACQDSDGDIHTDDQDNCLLLGNDQTNSDSDPLGDACDPDDDNDKILDDGDHNGINFDHPCMLGSNFNCDDNCPIKPNLSQSDPEGDGIGQDCDKCPQIYNAYDNSDTDHDGLGNVCDPDSDNDGVLDDGDHSGHEGDHTCTAGNTLNCDDNCPLVKNQNQLDYNKNGIGSWCEKGDHPNFGQVLEDDEHSFTWVPGRAFDIPLPGEGDNLDWGQNLLGLGYRETLNLKTNVDVYAQVVDSEGTSQARSSRHAANMRNLTLRFEPEAFAFQGGLEIRLFGASAPTQDLPPIAPSAIRYYLQLYPAESVSYTQTYTFSVQVTGNVPFPLYLPVVRK